MEYIVNLDEFRQGYGKNHKRSLNQKVDLFIFIFEYFTNTLLYFFQCVKIHFKIILSLNTIIFIHFPFIVNIFVIILIFIYILMDFEKYIFRSR